VRLNLNGNLVGGSTHTARTNLESGANVVKSLLQGNDCVSTGLSGNTFECSIDNAFCKTLLAIKENLVDELGNNGGAVDGICDDGALGSGSFTWHYFFSIFAP
jgi:hypothetical protein